MKAMQEEGKLLFPCGRKENIRGGWLVIALVRRGTNNPGQLRYDRSLSLRFKFLSDSRSQRGVRDFAGFCSVEFHRAASMYMNASAFFCVVCRSIGLPWERSIENSAAEKTRSDSTLVDEETKLNLSLRSRQTLRNILTVYKYELRV